MKKTSYILLIMIVFLFTLTVKVNADALDTIDITIDKANVHPDENVTLNIVFGKELGSYTFDIAYDNNLFEYVSAEGGTANDNGTRVRVYYFDSSGGTNPRNDMSITFKAKSDIITSNPTNFSVTGEGFANADASVQYDDILVPIVKDVIVEPIFVDYNIELNYDGNIIENEEKDIKIIISSTLGKNYEHVRLIAETTTPDGGNVKLLATDSAGLEHDIIQSGWGEASGYKIGGKDVNQVLNTRGIFDKAGQYNIILKLIDRDSSDATIAEKSFNIDVQTKDVVNDENNSNNENGTNNENNSVIGNTTNNENNNIVNENNTNVAQNNTEEILDKLPKTGINIYLVLTTVIILLSCIYIYLKRK